MFLNTKSERKTGYALEKKKRNDMQMAQTQTHRQIADNNEQGGWMSFSFVEMRIVRRKIVKCLFTDRWKNNFITFSFFIRWISKTFIEIFGLTRIFLKTNKKNEAQHNSTNYVLRNATNGFKKHKEEENCAFFQTYDSRFERWLNFSSFDFLPID